MFKRITYIINDELFNAHFLTTFIVMMIGLLNDAVDLKTSILGLYCISSVSLQTIPYVIYFLYMIFLNIKVHLFFCKNRREVDEIFYNKNFTKDQWISYLLKANFTKDQSIFVLDMYIDRGVFILQGNHYRYNAEKIDF